MGLCGFDCFNSGNNNNRRGGKVRGTIDRSNHRMVINKCYVTIVYSLRSSTLSFLPSLARATYMALRLAIGRLYGVFESRSEILKLSFTLI